MRGAARIEGDRRSARHGLVPLGLAALAVLASPSPAAAHPLAPASLRFVERAGEPPGTFEVRFRSSLVRPLGVRLVPVLPSRCVEVPGHDTERVADAALESTRWVRCADPAAPRRGMLGGMDGAEVAVLGLERTGENVVVEVEALGGGRALALLHAGAPRAVLRATASGTSPAAGNFVRLGAEHLATGFDHVLFVLGLVVSVTRLRPLVGLLTAFTVGHAVSLGAASLGRVPVPAAWVEVAIAASLLWLALRLLGGLDAERAVSSTHEAPGGEADAPVATAPAQRLGPSWAVCMGFGLVHGLGFAGAFGALGVTAAALPRALLGFNVGLELAQLALVLPMGLVLGWVRRAHEGTRSMARITVATAYVVGATSAYLLLDRLPDALR